MIWISVYRFRHAKNKPFNFFLQNSILSLYSTWLARNSICIAPLSALNHVVSSLKEGYSRWKGTSGHQPYHLVIPSVPACIVSVVITQPASLESCHIPRILLRHISKQVPSCSIWSQNSTLSKKSKHTPTVASLLRKSLTSTFYLAKLVKGANPMTLSIYLEFTYEFQWERGKCTGQIQINVSKLYPKK